MRIITGLTTIALNGAVIMFSAPFVHIHGLGYWAATLIGYTVSNVISYGTYAGIYAERIVAGRESTGTDLGKALNAYSKALTK